MICDIGCSLCEDMPFPDDTTGWPRLIRCLIFVVIFCKRALLLVANLRKVIHEIRHPMGLRHPVFTASVSVGVIAVCGGVWQCVTVCCSLLQSVGLCCIVLHFSPLRLSVHLQRVDAYTT